MNRRLLGWTGAVAAVGTASTIALWPRAQAQETPGAQKAPSNESAPIPIAVVTPEATADTTALRLTGQVDAYRIATIASEVADRVQSRPIERGDALTVGQTIALLNSDLALATLHQAQAAALQATAARQQAEAEYARAVVETRAAVSQANAQLETAQAAEQKAHAYTRSQELAQAEAAWTAAKAEETLAQKDYNRYEQLVKEDTLPRQTLDRARTALDAATARRESAEQVVSLAKEGARREDIAQATAQVAVARAGVAATSSRPQRLEAIRRQVDALRAQERQAQAGVEQAQIAIRKRQIVTPFAGRVLETLIEPGEMASPGRSIARIADVRTIKAVFALPEMLRGNLAIEERVSLTADGLPNATFDARVKVIGYEADRRARTFPVEIAIHNPQEKLLPGMVVRLNVRQKAAKAEANRTVPVSAIASDGTGSYILRIVGGKLQRQNVTLGDPVGADRVTVLTGLTTNEPIAADPQRLIEGTPVTVLAPQKQEVTR